MDCIHKCKQKAISYKAQLRFTGKSGNAVNTKPVRLADEGVTRRKFFTYAAFFGLTRLAAKAQQQLQGDGRLAEIIDRQPPSRPVAITPPGSGSARNMARHCTSCQLCELFAPIMFYNRREVFLRLCSP
jgi:hypothetical protein